MDIIVDMTMDTTMETNIDIALPSEVATTYLVPGRGLCPGEGRHHKEQGRRNWGRRYEICEVMQS